MSDPWVIITADVNVNSTEQGWRGIIYNPNDYKGTGAVSSGGGSSAITNQTTAVSDAMVAKNTGYKTAVSKYVFRPGQAGVKALIHFEEVFNAEPDTR